MVRAGGSGGEAWLRSGCTRPRSARRCCRTNCSSGECRGGSGRRRMGVRNGQHNRNLSDTWPGLLSLTPRHNRASPSPCRANVAMDLHDMVSRQQHELLQLQRHASASSHAGSVIGMMSVEESQNLLPAGEQVAGCRLLPDAFGCIRWRSRTSCQVRPSLLMHARPIRSAVCLLPGVGGNNRGAGLSAGQFIRSRRSSSTTAWQDTLDSAPEF